MESSRRDVRDGVGILFGSRLITELLDDVNGTAVAVDDDDNDIAGGIDNSGGGRCCGLGCGDLDTRVNGGVEGRRFMTGDEDLCWGSFLTSLLLLFLAFC